MAPTQMQAETSDTVQLMLFVGSEQLGNRLFVPLRSDNWRCVVATPGNAEGSRKVLPPSWVDFFQDG